MDGCCIARELGVSTLLRVTVLVRCHQTSWNFYKIFSQKFACSVGYEDPSYRRKLPLAPIPSPNRIRLIADNCCFPCCVFAKSELGGMPEGGMPEQKLWRIQLLPKQQDSTLHVSEELHGAAGLVQHNLTDIAGAARQI